MKEKVAEIIEEFCRETHGSSDYDKDHNFVQIDDNEKFVPLTYLTKKIPEIDNPSKLLKAGFIFSTYNFMEHTQFEKWYQHQFSKKLTKKMIKDMALLHWPDHKGIFEAVEVANKTYDMLREMNVILNGKNLPVQLGEWYAKSIFGLKQVKSSSQRGFDFVQEDNKKVEVKVHWNDVSSPKGVKIKKSMLELSDFCILIYISQNFMIRDVLFLDSNFLLRKFSIKGHTVFLKDSDIAGYFFSKSDKHFDKVKNKNALLKFASPQLAMKLDSMMN